jgi:hypothetical protein
MNVDAVRSQLVQKVGRRVDASTAQSVEVFNDQRGSRRNLTSLVLVQKVTE